MKIIQEHVLLSEEHAFLISIFDEPDLSYPFHQHKTAYELTVTVGLSGTRMVGDSTEQFFDKDAVLMSPGLPHCWQDHGMKPNGTYKVIVIHFSEDIFTKNISQRSDLKNVYEALRASKSGLKLNEEGYSECLRIIEELDETRSFDNYIRILKLLNTFGQNSFTSRLCSEGYSKPEYLHDERKLEKALQFIQDNYSRKLPIGEIAKYIHMSPSAFSHFFKKRTLKSFTEYVLELRLGKAAQLLQFSDMLVTRVGFESGFHNNSYFNSAFKKKYKTTPLKFRKLRQLV